MVYCHSSIQQRTVIQAFESPTGIQTSKTPPAIQAFNIVLKIMRSTGLLSFRLLTWLFFSGIQWPTVFQAFNNPSSFKNPVTFCRSSLQQAYHHSSMRQKIYVRNNIQEILLTINLKTLKSSYLQEAA
jgi:hypothetical protein